MTLGHLVKALGLGGEVKLLPTEDYWAEALTSKNLWLVWSDSTRNVRVENSRPHGPRMVSLRIQGVTNREAAEELVGSELQLRLDDLDVSLPEAPRPFQLRGLSVLLPDGSELGSITEILHYPAHDVLAVRGQAGEYLVPQVEPIVQEVDLDAGLVRIDPPPGLLELGTGKG